MFKILDQQKDVREKTTPVNEVIFFDKNIFTGTTGVTGETNIRNFNNWQSASVTGSIFQSLYSSNFTSASAVSLANITYGQSISSSFYTNATAVNKVEKSKMYRLFAKYLLGDEDSLFSISGTIRNELIFLSIARSQAKDELKKQSTTINSVFSGTWNTRLNSRTFSDTNASNVFAEGVRGHSALLFSGSECGGQIFYQAGIIVLIPEIWSNTSSFGASNNWSGTMDYGALVTTGSFQHLLNGMRYRFENTTFTNQSNLQASYYYCRMLNDEFNYSSNPTAVDNAGRIITTSGSTNYGAITYATKVALLDENNAIMAVACLNNPIKKSFESEQTVIVRLDF